MTLVELLVATALMIPVLVIVMMMYTLGERVCKQSAALVEAQEHGRIALEEMVHELQYAQRVTVESSGLALFYYKWVDGEEKRYRFYLAGHHLLLNLPEGTAVPLAAFVDEVRFEPVGKLREREPVQITVRVTYEGHTSTLRSQVTPRNIREEG
jgi:hypothetical protein